jgi:iron complex outermembrane receptor protein
VVQTSVTINAAVPVTETAELYGYANLSRRQADAAATWRTAYTSGTTLRTPLYPQGFSPNQASVGEDISSVLGVRGRNDGWRWDLSANYGQNEFSLT